MAATVHTQTVEATVTVRVSQAADGDIVVGARRQLERVDGVAVEELTITGIQPGLNDTTVEAVATLSVEGERPVRERLADGFGVDPDCVERVERG
jgi:hypothetical protein